MQGNVDKEFQQEILAMRFGKELSLQVVSRNFSKESQQRFSLPARETVVPAEAYPNSCMRTRFGMLMQIKWSYPMIVAIPIVLAHSM